MQKKATYTAHIKQREEASAYKVQLNYVCKLALANIMIDKISKSVVV